MRFIKEIAYLSGVVGFLILIALVTVLVATGEVAPMTAMVKGFLCVMIPMAGIGILNHFIYGVGFNE